MEMRKREHRTDPADEPLNLKPEGLPDPRGLRNFIAFDCGVAIAVLQSPLLDDESDIWKEDHAGLDVQMLVLMCYCNP